MRVTRYAQVVLLSAVLAVTGCEGTSGAPAGGNAAGAPRGGGEPKGEPVCELLTAAEITEAIGEHDGGEHDYARGGCVWTANAPVQDGFTEEISATVQPGHLYRKLAEYDSGDPIEGFGEDAKYSPNHGQLWFRCGEEWCGVKAAIFDGDGREATAKRLARLIESRR